jgi:hypothetical protein
MPSRQETQVSEEEAVPDEVAYDLFEKVEVVVDASTGHPGRAPLVAQLSSFTWAPASEEQALCEVADDLFETVEVLVNPSGLHHHGVAAVGRCREDTRSRRRDAGSHRDPAITVLSSHAFTIMLWTCNRV